MVIVKNIMKKLLVIVLFIGIILLAYLVSKNNRNTDISPDESQSETKAPNGPIIEEFETENMEDAEKQHLENSRRSAPSLPSEALIQTETGVSTE